MRGVRIVVLRRRQRHSCTVLCLPRTVTSHTVTHICHGPAPRFPWPGASSWPSHASAYSPSTSTSSRAGSQSVKQQGPHWCGEWCSAACPAACPSVFPGPLPPHFCVNFRPLSPQMDVGVGAFAFFAGALSRRARGAPVSAASTSTSAAVLAGLGTARTAVTAALNYHVPVTEYGVHWNFFLTLSVLCGVGPWLQQSSPVATAAVGTAITAAHQALLTAWPLQDWILHGDRSTGLFAQNREGVVGLPGPQPRGSALTAAAGALTSPSTPHHCVFPSQGFWRCT